MDNQRVAVELVKVAKSLIADEPNYEAYESLLKEVKKGNAILTAGKIHDDIPTIHEMGLVASDIRKTASKFKQSPLAVYDNDNEDGHLKLKLDITGPIEKSGVRNAPDGSGSEYHIGVQGFYLSPLDDNGRKRHEDLKWNYSYRIDGKNVENLGSFEKAIQKELEGHIVRKTEQEYSPNQWAPAGSRIPIGKRGSTFSNIVGRLIKASRVAAEGRRGRRANAVYDEAKRVVHQLVKNTANNGTATITDMRIFDLLVTIVKATGDRKLMKEVEVVREMADNLIGTMGKNAMVAAYERKLSRLESLINTSARKS